MSKFDLSYFLKVFAWTFWFALVVSAVLTWLDWKANPSDFFNEDNVNQLATIAGKIRSWIFPIWIILLLISMISIIIYKQVKK